MWKQVVFSYAAPKKKHIDSQKERELFKGSVGEWKKLPLSLRN